MLFYSREVFGQYLLLLQQEAVKNKKQMPSFILGSFTTIRDCHVHQHQHHHHHNPYCYLYHYYYHHHQIYLCLSISKWVYLYVTNNLNSLAAFLSICKTQFLLKKSPTYKVGGTGLLQLVLVMANIGGRRRRRRGG